MEAPIAQVMGLHKSYGSGTTLAPVLRGVDMSIHRGECVFLVGPSGCGKSTLLSIFGCILTPDEGEVRLFGEDVRRWGSSARARLRLNRVGFVFQRFHLIRRLRVFDNVREKMQHPGGGKSWAGQPV